MLFSRRNFLRTLAATLIVLPISSLYAESTNNVWSFGVIPDTQWKLHQEAPFYGTAIHVIDAINAEMIRHKVDFVVAVGDLVDESSSEAFQTRAAHNKALVEAGIKFYPFRGNHDARGLKSVAQFRESFPNLPGTPGGGGSSPDLPGAAGMTYSFTHKGGKFICLDTFPLVDDGTEEGKAYPVSDYLPWIESELKKDDHQFSLVFAHKNLLGQNHKDTIFSSDKTNQDANPEMQNAFIGCLQRYGVRYYLSGHDHMYHRSRIKSPDGKSEIEQIICGSAAHKFYRPEPPFSDRATVMAQELDRIGFLIVRVEGERLRFEYYSTEPFGDAPKTPVWTLRDSFE